MERRVIFFDLDGTLFQTHLTSVKAAQRALEDMHLDAVEEKRIIGLFGEPMDEFCKGIAPGLEQLQRRKLADLISQHEMLLVKEKGKLYAGVADMLDELKSQGFTMAICSNGRLVYIRTVLEACGIESYFSYVRGRDNSTSKEAAIAEILRESDASHALVVGDRIHDLEAARNNNICSIGAAYGYGNEEAHQADFCAFDIGDVLGYIHQCSVFESIRSGIEKGVKTIGINGVDTSGKTSFAKGLSKYLDRYGIKNELVHMDDFHNPSSIRNKDKDPIESYINNAFNIECLENEILRPVSIHGQLEKRLSLLDLETDRFTSIREYKVDKDTIVIVEGVLLYRPPLDKYLDYKIYLDIGFDEVLKRAEIRDVPKYGMDFLDRYRNKYIPIQQRYISEHKPKEKCDMIVDNNDFIRPFIRV